MLRFHMAISSKRQQLTHLTSGNACAQKKKKKLDQELNEVALWDIQIYSEMLAGYYYSNVITVVVVSKLKIIRWVILLFKLP